MLAHGIVKDRVVAYERATGDVLRPLDPTEHNMERLNARARGSGRTYHTLVLEGPLVRAALERALDVLASRHPLLRARIVRGDDGVLSYAATRGDRADGTARIPVTYVIADDLGVWPELVEKDMNGGAVASERGPLFAFAVIVPPRLTDGAPGKRVLVMVGHHGACDGTSAIALLHELLEQLAEPNPLVTLENRALDDPFCLEFPVPELAGLEARLRAAVERPGAIGRAELEALHARLEALELALIQQEDEHGRFPSALKRIHACLLPLDAELRAARGIVPEVDLGSGERRYERARTALLWRTLEADRTGALRRAAKERGLTLHGVFSAAVLVALAAEGRAEPASERVGLASAVSLRRQLVPPLAPHELRMAVDIVVSRVEVESGVGFWELARRAGDDVTLAVARRRALSSSFRTVRRDFADAPPGVALPLLSNLGKVELKTRYGSLRVVELCAAMTAHGSFQLAALFLTFDERLSASFYCETPTVARTSLERFAARVFDALTSVANGDEPRVPG